jgi:pyruvate/2-oxoglutarate dehydrogenase complex dihydrolipoamide acyltransferase (E2) component
MATQILMPALSPTMTEGKLSRWLKHVGDDVRAGDVIAEIETDKATMEVEAVDEGKLAQILVDEGTEGVAVNTPIAVLSMNGETVAMAPKATPKGLPAPEPQARPAASARPPMLSRPRRLPWHPRRTGARPRRSPCGRPCAMRWRRKCAPTATCF